MSLKLQQGERESNFFSSRGKKTQCSSFLSFEYPNATSFAPYFLCLFCLCNMQNTWCYLWLLVSDNCVGSSLEVFHQQVYYLQTVVVASFTHLNGPQWPQQKVEQQTCTHTFRIQVLGVMLCGWRSLCILMH